MRQSKYIRQSRYALLFLTDFTAGRKKDEMLNVILQVALESRLSGFLILAYNQETQVWSLVTYGMFHKNCAALSRRVIETFTMHNFTNKIKASFLSVFSKKIDNMRKCPVHVALAKVEPYVIEYRYRNKSKFDGIDVRILREIANHMNFTPKFILPKNGMGRGIVYDNGSATGAMEQVVNGEANLTIGVYLLTESRSFWLSPSVTYMQDRIGFAIRTRYLSPSSLDNLMGPFNYVLWYLILITLCTAVIFILLTKRLKPHQRTFLIGGKLYRTPILTALHIAIGGSISNPRMMDQPRYFGTFARTCAMLWIIFFLFVRTSYESGLFTFFQRPPVFSKCDSFEKILAYKCKIIAPDSGVHHLVSLNATLNQFILCNENALTCTAEMFEGDAGDVAFVHELTKKYFNHLYAPDFIADYTKDQVFLIAPVFLLEKNSILRPSINHFLRLYDQSGLIAHWIDQYTNEKKGGTKSPGTMPQLKLNNVMALLNICTCLYVFSIVVFVMELLVNRWHFLKHAIDFITY